MVSAIEVQRERRRTVLAEYDGIDAAIAASGAALTDEQSARQDAILAEVQTIDAAIARDAQRRSLIETAPALPAGSGATVIEAITPTQEPKPFRSFGEQLAAVARAGKDLGVHPGLSALTDWSRMQAAASGASELVGSDGGFLVQSDFSNDLIQRVYDAGILANRVTRRPIGANSNGVTINRIDETSRANGSRSGGVQAYWTGEAVALTGSKPKLSQTKLDLVKLTGLYYATDELLGDATALESFATAEFVKEFKFKIDDAIFRGTGAGMPRGILAANALVTVSKETGQAADTLLAENVWKMYARLSAGNLGNAVWFINQALWPQVFQLQQAVGVGGVALFQPATGIAGAPFGSLLGRPIIPIEYASAPGDVGDITFLDLSEYLVIEKGGIAAASSIHVAFLTDETTFRWVLRTNGSPTWLSALTPFKGTDTVSPYITLEAR